jgi:predicted transcriptional regulator YdeE
MPMLTKWLPSDYEVICAPAISFTRMAKEKPDTAHCEIWMPVRKKAVNRAAAQLAT